MPALRSIDTLSQKREDVAYLRAFSAQVSDLTKSDRDAADGGAQGDSDVPGPDVVQYYRRRAEGGAGLILAEGTYIDHPVSGNNPGYLRLNSEKSIAGWAEVVRQVHEVGGLIMPELWHVGSSTSPRN